MKAIWITLNTFSFFFLIGTISKRKLNQIWKWFSIIFYFLVSELFSNLIWYYLLSVSIGQKNNLLRVIYNSKLATFELETRNMIKFTRLTMK